MLFKENLPKLAISYIEIETSKVLLRIVNIWTLLKIRFNFCNISWKNRFFGEKNLEKSEKLFSDTRIHF